MKALLLIVSLISFSSVFAQSSTDIKNGDLSLSQAASAVITNITPICPADPNGGPTCMAYGSVVTVKVTLNGCVDRLGGYFSHFEMIEGRATLKFGAVNIFNKTSMVARCIKIPTHFVKVNIPYEGEVQLVELPFTGTKQEM